MRTAAEDSEVTQLLRERDRIDARLAALEIDVSVLRPTERRTLTDEEVARIIRATFDATGAAVLSRGLLFHGDEPSPEYVRITTDYANTHYGSR